MADVVLDFRQATLSLLFAGLFVLILDHWLLAHRAGAVLAKPLVDAVWITERYCKCEEVQQKLQ